MSTLPDASNWRPIDLMAQLSDEGDEVVEALLWDVPVCFWFSALDMYSVTVYPRDGEEIEAEPVATAAEALAIARNLCRPYALDAYDAWLLREAQRTGLQPCLPL